MMFTGSQRKRQTTITSLKWARSAPKCLWRRKHQSYSCAGWLHRSQI